MEFGKNPTTGSQDIVQPRKCHADTDADADANGIRAKINISPRRTRRWGNIIRRCQRVGYEVITVYGHHKAADNKMCCCFLLGQAKMFCRLFVICLFV